MNSKTDIIEEVKVGEILCLYITTFNGISINAEHYYADLKPYYYGERHGSVELKRKITTVEEARYLNKKNGCDRRYWLYKVGTETNLFNSEKDIIKEARNQYKILFPNATVILLGNTGIAQPQKMIVGPKNFKRLNNILWKRYEEIYDLNEKGKITDEKMHEMHQVFWKEWQKIWPQKYI